MRGGIGVRSAQLAIVALCVAAAVIIVLIALDTTPIADDYGDLANIQHSGVFQYLHDYWVGLTDRYSNAIFMVVLVKLFGAAAIHIATPLLIAMLVCLCAVAAHSASGVSVDGRYGAPVVGVLGAITLAVSTPSIFDTLGWFNAVAIYLTGIVAAAGAAAWIARLTVRRTLLTYRHAVASFVIGFIAAGFTELVGIVIALGSLLALTNLRDVSPSGPRRRSLETAYAAVAAGAAIGVIVIFAGPGSRARAHTQHGGFNLTLIASEVRANLGWARANLGWRTLMSLASGLALLQLRGPTRSERSLRWLVFWALFLCFVPLLVVGVATGYSGVPVPALRTASVATASIAAGEAVIAYVIAAALVSARPILAAMILPGAAVAAAIGVVGFGVTVTPVIRAELLRRTAVDARALSIRRQLVEPRRRVSVMPAPLIDPNESAYDLVFGRRRQLNYVLANIREYYEIPPDVAIHVIPLQPRAYCLPHVSVQSYGVKSCAQFHSPQPGH